jgi:hypothetical protein
MVQAFAIYPYIATSTRNAWFITIMICNAISRATNACITSIKSGILTGTTANIIRRTTGQYRFVFSYYGVDHASGDNDGDDDDADFRVDII